MAGTAGSVCYLQLSGLPTSISCQRYSKMVARAASSLYRKKGQSAVDGAKEEGRGDAEEGEERGRAESTATPPPPSPLFFSLPFASFPSAAWWRRKPAQKTGKGGKF